MLYITSQQWTAKVRHAYKREHQLTNLNHTTEKTHGSQIQLNCRRHGYLKAITTSNPVHMYQHGRITNTIKIGESNCIVNIITAQM